MDAVIMKLSSLIQYRTYMKAYARRDYEGALSALKECVDVIGAEGEPNQLGYLFQLMGEVVFLGGNPQGALGYLEKAEEVSQGSPLIRYYKIEFLASKAKNYVAAIDAGERLRKDLEGREIPKSEGEPGKQFYLAKLYSVEGYCYACLGDYSRAGGCLKSLLSLDVWDAPEYTIPLCEILVENGEFLSQAKECLERYLRDRERPEPNGTDKYIDEFRETVKRILIELAQP